MVGIILIISSNRFVTVFKNTYLGLNLKAGEWFFHDDTSSRYLKPIDDLGLNNILNSCCINLLIYMLNN